MKKALISTIEPRETGYRVAQVVEQGQDFPVSAEMFWTDCADDAEQDRYWYDPSDETIKAVPIISEPVPEKTLAQLVEELVIMKLQALSANTN